MGDEITKKALISYLQHGSIENRKLTDALLNATLHNINYAPMWSKCKLAGILVLQFDPIQL